MQPAAIGRRSSSRLWISCFLSQHEGALCRALTLTFAAVFFFSGGCSVEDSGNSASHGEGNKTLSLGHDFGILKPEEQVEHRFVIENETDMQWTFRKVIKSCACTVTDLSAPAIEPGKEETATVTYTAGGVTQNDQRRIVVLFEEAQAPRVVLHVRARVRESMTRVPPKLELLDLGKGKSSQTNLEVQNFSDHDWKSISLQPSADWLAASSTPLDFDRDGEQWPRQIWRITVTADASTMGVGAHHGHIEVTAEGPEKLFHRIPVHASVISTVIAIPEQIFFGKVTTGESTSRSVTLRFSPDAVPESQEQIRLQHSLGDQLQLEWSRTEGQSWELSAAFTPDGSRQVSGQKVTISFSDPELPSLMIPIYAFVEDK